MSLFLQFGKTPPPTDCDGNPSASDTTRPFVPSVAPEDVEKAREIGVLSPKSLNKNDLIPTPFVKKMPTWAQKTKNIDPENDHLTNHKKLIDDIDFLLMQENNENQHILDHAEQWIEEQHNILWAPTSGYPSFFHDNISIAHAESIPKYTRQEIKIVRLEPLWSIGSINGVANIYIPWGSETNYLQKPKQWQQPFYRKPLRIHDFIYAQMEFHPQGRNIWKVTKIFPKLPTPDLLESMVSSTTEYQEFKPICRDGSQFNYIIPCNPSNIGNIIGQNGKNINSLINHIQKKRKDKWYGPMPKHIDPDYPQFPLPEVTITPIEPPDTFSGPSTHISNKAYVRVYCPTCCIWDKENVDELVSYMHS